MSEAKYCMDNCDCERLCHEVEAEEQEVLKEAVHKALGIPTNFEESLDFVLNDLRELLLSKNRKYGNSMFEPSGVFFKGDRLAAINARIDDKLARKKSDQEDEDEDIDMDLMGYLVARIIINKNLM